MNHYQRLKVSPDAPAEVIRAAYRALAAKLHPDRLGGSAGPEDAAHAEMAALNAAYEVLIDPRLREGYNATLAQTRVPSTEVSDAADAAGPASRVDMDWLTPRTAVDTPWWPPEPRLLMLGGVLVMTLGLGIGMLVSHLSNQNQIDKALSDQYAALPPSEGGREPSMPTAVAASVHPHKAALATEDGEAGAPSVPPTAPVAHKPTVDELARMSDEELLRALPALDNEGPLAGRGPGGSRNAAAEAAERIRQHMLDGKPLNLRTETHLVDPLAPEAASSH